MKSARNFGNGVNNNKCCGCSGPHLYRNCHHNLIKKTVPLNMLQESSTVNGIARNIPRINVALEDHQEDHQTTMLEEESKILNIFPSLLI